MLLLLSFYKVLNKIKKKKHTQTVKLHVLVVYDSKTTPYLTN